MYRIVVVLFLLASGNAFAQPALTVSCEDRLFAKDSTHQRIVAAFGKQNVALVKEPDGPIRTQVTSVIYPKDPKRKLTVVWEDGEARAVPHLLIIEKPSQWTAPGGVRLGAPLEELERLNGAPFAVSGFSVMFGGEITWNGALDALPGGCTVAGTMQPTVKLPKPQMDKISKDEKFSSADPLMRQAQPVMSKLLVFFKSDR